MPTSTLASFGKRACALRSRRAQANPVRKRISTRWSPSSFFATGTGTKPLPSPTTGPRQLPGASAARFRHGRRHRLSMARSDYPAACRHIFCAPPPKTPNNAAVAADILGRIAVVRLPMAKTAGLRRHRRLRPTPSRQRRHVYLCRGCHPACATGDEAESRHKAASPPRRQPSPDDPGLFGEAYLRMGVLDSKIDASTGRQAPHISRKRSQPSPPTVARTPLPPLPRLRPHGPSARTRRPRSRCYKTYSAKGQGFDRRQASGGDAIHPQSQLGSTPPAESLRARRSPQQSRSRREFLRAVSGTASALSACSAPSRPLRAMQVGRQSCPGSSSLPSGAEPATRRPSPPKARSQHPTTSSTISSLAEPSTLK